MAHEPTSRSRLAALAGWFPFLLVSMMLHAAWWILVPMGRASVPATTRPDHPTFAFMASEPGIVARNAWQEDVRAQSSPALFSVPTPMGFSAPVLGSSARLDPPENPVVAQPLLATRQPYVPPGLTWDPDRELRVFASSLPLRDVGAPAFPAREVETNVVLHITWNDANGSLRYQSIDVGNASPWVDKKPWDAQALLEVDEFGSVHHVFLEKASPLKERNAALVRILAALRLDVAATSSMSRVTVRYEGSAAAPESAAKP